MRFVHTSDWHLGHTLHDIDRGGEHDAFLAWLLDQLDAHDVDALIVAGDVFDTANPSAAAQRRWYEFLGAARTRRPTMHLVVVGGNHDSAARLDAPGMLLDALRIHVVGGLPVLADGSVDVDRVLVPLHDASGAVAAWVVAIPFLRPSDVGSGASSDTAEGLSVLSALHAQLFDAARARRQPGQALIATGHLHLAEGQVSDQSERTVRGLQHAIPASMYPDDVTYVALGHLHLAQQVGAPHVRYSGSPIPLALVERTYPHQVLLVDVEGGDLRAVRSLHVPRTVDIVRVPEVGEASLDELFSALAALPAESVTPRDTWPLLEVVVRLTAPEPGLTSRVQQALAGKAVRLARLAVSRAGSGLALGDGEHAPAVGLRDLDVDDVFKRMWTRTNPDPDDDILRAWHDAVALAQAEGA